MIKNLLVIFTDPFNVLFIVIIILLTIYYAKIIGYMGEFWVRQELKRLNKKEYITLNNIMLKENNETHQIDHIVLSKYGIFVIETKNYSGIIKGNKYSNEWMQILGRNRYYFKNPIYQNYGHIKTLSSILNLDEKYFISIICYSNHSRLKVNDKNVINLDFLNKTILNYNDIVLDKNLEELKNIIIQNNIVDKKIRKGHVKEIKSKIKDQNALIENGICPKCGGNLLKKHSKYGSFLGCSNYPKCRFVKNIK